jgi:hypothetical protein
MKTYAAINPIFVAPDSTSEIYKSGEHCNNAKPGDIVLVKHKGTMPLLIRTGQRIYYWRKRLFGHKEYEKAYCNFNHAAVVVEGGKNIAIVEMEAHGGHKTYLANYQAEEYAVIKITATPAQKQDAVNFANYCLNIEYGFLSIAAIVLNVLIGWGISFSNRGLICSAATSLSARCMGLIPDGPDITVMPADLARYFGVKNG